MNSLHILLIAIGCGVGVSLVLKKPLPLWLSHIGFAALGAFALTLLAQQLQLENQLGYAGFVVLAIAGATGGAFLPILIHRS